MKHVLLEDVLFDLYFICPMKRYLRLSNVVT